MKQIRRMNRIKEELQFFYADSETPALVIPIDINTDDMSAAAMRAWETLGIASVELDKEPENEKIRLLYGQALVALFGVIMGEENAKKILDFYEGREGEMLIDLNPFFTELLEKIKAARDARIAQFLTALGKTDA